MSSTFNGVAANVSYADQEVFTLAAIIAILVVPSLSVLYGQDVNKGLTLAYQVIAPMSVMWGLIGYSMKQGSLVNTSVIGGGQFMTINQVGPAANPENALQYAYIFYDFMYAMCAMSIVIGGIGQVFKTQYFAIFALGSLLVVYLPLACWMWNLQGWMYQYGIYDYSGGMVTHGYAGVTVLILGLLSRKPRARVDFGSTKSLLASFGFFMGKQALQVSNGSLDGAFSSLGSLNTVVSAWMGVLVYNFMEILLPKHGGKPLRGKPTGAGACKGAVVGITGLAAGAGFMFPEWACLSVVCSTVLVYILDYATQHVNIAGWDCFISHGASGLIGSAVVGLYAQNDAFASGQKQIGSWMGNPVQLGVQCAGISTVVLLTGVMTPLLYGLIYLIGFAFQDSIFEDEVEEPKAAAPEAAVPAAVESAENATVLSVV